MQQNPALRNNGVKKGDKVLVILKRNYEYWYIVPALHKLGAVVIPATNMLTLDDITYRIETANIKFAVSTPDDVTAETLVQAKAVKSQLEKVIQSRLYSLPLFFQNQKFRPSYSRPFSSAGEFFYRATGIYPVPNMYRLYALFQRNDTILRVLHNERYRGRLYPQAR